MEKKEEMALKCIFLGYKFQKNSGEKGKRRKIASKLGKKSLKIKVFGYKLQSGGMEKGGK